MPQLETSTYPSLIFWLFVSFFLLYLFLSKFVLPRLAKTLQVRADHIDILKDQRESLLEQIKEIEQRMEHRLAEVRDDATNRILDAEKSFQKALDENSRALNKEIKKKEAELLRRLAKEQRLVLEKFKDKLPGLSVDMFHTITGRSYDKKNVAQVVDHAYQELLEAQEANKSGGAL